MKKISLRNKKSISVNKRYVVGIVFLVVAGILQLLAREVDGFAEWYANHIYPLFVNTVGRIFGLLPFSVFEFMVYSLIILLLLFVIFGIVALKNKHGRQYFYHKIGVIVCIVGIAAFTYTATCGVNYFRRSFSEEQGLITTGDYSLEELIAICNALEEKLNACADQMTVGRDGATLTSDKTSLIAKSAMENLAKEYSSLAGFYPQPKLLLNSWFLSIQQVTGIYSPFTVEANVNHDMPAYNVLFTACHELSHLRGFMREDEANFIAYLACISSDDVACQYSGYATAFIQCTNALYRNGGQAEYTELFQHLSETVENDYYKNNQFWAKYETKVSEAAQNVNNTYLQANGQSEGIKSYGRMVDLILARWRQKGTL